MELVAFVGSDKENWGQVTALLKRAEWDNVIIVKSKGAEDFPKLATGDTLIIDSEEPLLDLKTNLMEKLKKLVKGFEVAVSIASGNGKEHMALISALINAPMGIRLVVFTKNGLEYIS